MTLPVSDESCLISDLLLPLLLHWCPALTAADAERLWTEPDTVCRQYLGCDVDEALAQDARWQREGVAPSWARREVLA